MKYQTQDFASHTLISVNAEKLDTTLAPDLKGQLIAISTQNPDKPLIIDLEKVRFADSSGLSALLMAHRLYRDNGQPCVLANVSERVMELLEISQLTKVFQLSGSVDQATAMFAGGDAT